MPTIDGAALAPTARDYLRDDTTQPIHYEVIGDAYGDISKHFTVIDGNIDEMLMPSVAFHSTLRPRQSGWNPSQKAMDIKGHYVKAYDSEITTEVGDQELQLMYRSFRARKRKAKNAQDKNKFYFEEDFRRGLIEKGQEDFSEDALFKGVRNDAGDKPEDTMNGYNKLALDGIAAGLLTPISTGLITPDDVVDQLEMFIRKVPQKHRRKYLKLYCSPEIYDLYFLRYRSKNNGNAPIQKEVIRKLMNGGTMKDSMITLDGTKCELVPVDGLAESQRMFISYQKNMIVTFDSEDDMRRINAEYSKRVFYIYANMTFGAGFRTYSEVWTNDQD